MCLGVAYILNTNYILTFAKLGKIILETLVFEIMIALIFIQILLIVIYLTLMDF